MRNSPDAQSWWHTLPGMLTAVAALVTAAGGILALLLQYGVLGGANEPNKAPSVGGTSPPAVSSPTPTGPLNSTPAGGGRPWSEVVAIFAARDGTTTTVRAETVRYCISVGDSLTLSTGQDVAFEKMRSVEVLRSDELFAPDGKADVVISLTDGQQLRGKIGSNCDFIGYNEVGRFAIYPQHLKRLDFQH